MESGLPLSVATGSSTSRGEGSIGRIDLLEPRRMSSRGWLLTALLLLLLFLPSLAFPLGPDQGMFFISGEKILQGAVYYRDIVDIKPPLIYYLYAGMIALFGRSAIAIRVCDMILQLLGCWLIVATIRRASGNDRIAATGAICLALLYVSMGYGETAQAESYGAMLATAVLYILMFRRTTAGFVLAGVLCGGMFLLKFTLGGMLVATLASEMVLFRTTWREVLRHAFLLLLGFSWSVLFLLLYVDLTGGYQDFLLVHRFLRGYIGLVHSSFPAALAEALRTIPLNLVGSYSLLFVVATASGVLYSCIRQNEVGAESAVDRLSQLLRFSTVALATLFLTNVVEGRYNAYQWSRLYPFGIILAVFGATVLLNRLLDTGSMGRYGWFIIPCMAAVVLLFGPLPRYILQSTPAMLTISDAQAYEASFERMASSYPRKELRAAGEYVRSHRKPEDRVFAASSVAALIYYFCDYIPDLKLYHSAFIMAPFSPTEWKMAVRGYLIHQHPRFLVLQIDDFIPTLAGTDMNSSEGLRHLPGIDSLVGSDYDCVMQGKRLQLYQRKEKI
jgi:hypothetical protein